MSWQQESVFLLYTHLRVCNSFCQHYAFFHVDICWCALGQVLEGRYQNPMVALARQGLSQQYDAPAIEWLATAATLRVAGRLSVPVMQPQPAGCDGAGHVCG